MNQGLKKTASDYLYNVMYQVLIILLPIVTAPYIARVLGADGVGQYAFVHTIAHYFMMFAMMGVATYGSRSIAQVREDREQTAYVFSGIVYLQQILTAIMLSLYALYVFLFSGEHQLLAAIQGLYVFSAALDINWFFFGLEQFKLTATRRIIVKLISAACVFIFVRQRSDLWVYCLIMSLDFVVAQGYLWLVVHRFTHFVRVPLRDVFRHLKSTILLFVPSIATNVYRNLSKLLLGMLATMAAVGLYEYSEKIILMSLGLLNALSTVMLPKMTALRVHNQGEASKRYLRGSMQFALCLAFAIGFGYAGIAPEFATVFLGPEFAQASPLMQGLAASVIFIAWANVIRMQYLIPNNLEKVMIVSTFSGFAVNVAAAFILIPYYGAMGAVVTTVLTEMTVTMIQTFQVRKQVEIKQYLSDALPFLVAGGVMYVVVRLLGNHFGQTVHGLIIQLVSGGTTFVLMSLFLLRHRASPMGQIIKSGYQRIVRRGKDPPETDGE